MVLKLKPVENKLRELRGNMAAVGRAFGVTRQAVADFVSRHEKLREVFVEARESMLDDAENSLYDAVLRGEAWAVCFYLKTQGKKRGYIEKYEALWKEIEELEAMLARRDSGVNGTAAGNPQAESAGRWTQPPR